MSEEAFLRQMRADPDDFLAREVFADWLEEQGDLRGDLLRITDRLTRTPAHGHGDAERARKIDEQTVRSLVNRGVRPVGPYWVNSVGIEFVWVPAGAFLMGSPADEPDRQPDEVPHPVTLSRGLYFSAFPITQQQWFRVTGQAPSLFQGEQRPVEGVSWHDCQAFCELLCKVEGLPADGPDAAYRLPTEAEWEYACRAGTSSPYFTGNAIDPNQANFHAHFLGQPGRHGPYRQETTPVGTFPPNAFGLQDMHGNVFEWCRDDYTAYPTDSTTDQFGRVSGDIKVLRGGSWNSLSGRCRSACRGLCPSDYRGSDAGCRVCFQLRSDFAL